MVKTKGGKQAKRAKPLHTDFEKLYARRDEELDLDSQEFRFTAIGTGILKEEQQHGSPSSAHSPKRLPKKERVAISELLETVEWRDEGNQYNLNTIPILRGTMSYRIPDPDVAGEQIVLRDGHKIRADVKWLGNWEPLWEMRIVAPPEHTIEDGTATAELADDLYLATLGQTHHRYRKGTKRRRRGWRYHQIVQDVCKRHRIPCGPLVKGTGWITNIDLDLSPPLEVIRQAALKEQEYTGRRLVICWRPDDNGRFCLQVRHAQRNPILYRFDEQIRQATVSPIRRAGLATAVVAVGSRKRKGGKRHRYSVRAESKTAIARFGYIERHVQMAGNVGSRSEVVARAKHDLAKNVKPVRILSNFVTTGIAFVRRGDTVFVRIPSQGFSGQAGFVFVTSVVHSLSGDDYTMKLELTWRDPLDPNMVRAEREAAMRARKRKQHGKKKG